MTHFLQAGPVHVRYEGGFLRYLMLDGHEVLRMIYFAVRDPRWQTAGLTITNEVISQTTDSFQIDYQWHTDCLGIHMTGWVAIEGAMDGSVSVDFYGEAINSFASNRVGICVLHPIADVSGQPCQVTHPNGLHTDGHFPWFISPHQPFLNIRQLRWQPASGHSLLLNFAGDVFETEDQRNWTDASFKTYSTPLVLPFPVARKPGDTVKQRVVFQVLADVVARQQTPVQGKVLIPGPTPDSRHKNPVRPFIGLGQCADGQPLPPAEAERLRLLALHHLRADVLLTVAGWESRLSNAIMDARALQVSLELALFFGKDPVFELNQLLLIMDIDNRSVAVSSVLIFSAHTLRSDDALLRLVTPKLRLAWPGALLGGGTDDSFVDLNRNPFDFALVDFVVYSINPQVHATDDLSVMESIEGQRATVQMAMQLTNGKPIHISPVTLLPRYPPIAESIAQRLSPPADVRQSTQFTADWTRQSIDVLSRAGAGSITFYETHGPRGLINYERLYLCANELSP